jgi:hypothetical protein
MKKRREKYGNQVEVRQTCAERGRSPLEQRNHAEVGEESCAVRGQNPDARTGCSVESRRSLQRTHAGEGEAILSWPRPEPGGEANLSRDRGQSPEERRTCAMGSRSLEVGQTCAERSRSPEEIGSHEPVVNPSADPAENKMDVEGRTLPVDVLRAPIHRAALMCGKRRTRRVAVGKGGNESNETLFMIGEPGKEDEAFDFRLMQPIDFLCDLQGYGQRFGEKVMGYFDSGSTSHLCPHIELFDEWMEFKSWIVLPNKSMMVVLAIGRVGALRNVLYVPDLDQVVISIGKLDEEGYRIVTFRGKIEVFTEDGEIMFTGSLRNGMYQLDPLPTEQLNAINVKDGSAPKKFATTIGEMSVPLWIQP